MTTQQKIQAIKEAIEKAEKHESKMDETAWSVPSLSSLKIRHLMNNLGDISTNYLECGVHRGGLFCSTIRNNKLDTAFAIDSFASDAITGEGIEDEFDKNSLKCIDGTQTAMMIKVADTFTVIPSDLPNGIDLYLYDAAHDFESQKKAVTYFFDVMADEYIMCVDDYDWEEVRKGTEEGLAALVVEGQVEIEFEQVFKGNDHDNDGWWNGFYVALLKKK